MTKIDDAGSPVVDVAYKTAAGETRVMPWNDLDPLAVADGSPYREFPWYLGQRNYSGMYWCATEVKLVGYESLLELSRLLMADFDRSAKRIVSQPFQIKASIDGGRRHPKSWSGPPGLAVVAEGQRRGLVGQFGELVFGVVDVGKVGTGGGQHAGTEQHRGGAHPER
jgi:hypothetical protein